MTVYTGPRNETYTIDNKTLTIVDWETTFTDEFRNKGSIHLSGMRTELHLAALAAPKLGNSSRTTAGLIAFKHIAGKYEWNKDEVYHITCVNDQILDLVQDLLQRAEAEEQQEHMDNLDLMDELYEEFDIFKGEKHE